MAKSDKIVVFKPLSALCKVFSLSKISILDSVYDTSPKNYPEMIGKCNSPFCTQSPYANTNFSLFKERIRRISQITFRCLAQQICHVYNNEKLFRCGDSRLNLTIKVEFQMIHSSVSEPISHSRFNMFAINQM